MKAIALAAPALACLAVACLRLQAQDVTLETPDAVPRFDAAEFVVKLESAAKGNPFTDLEFDGEFTLPDGRRLLVAGFCDSQDGRVYRLRFSPEHAGAVYPYRLRLRGADVDWQSTGQLRCEASSRPGPVIADPKHPRHFIRAGTGAPFYHLGFTAYDLLDPANDDSQVEATIGYAAGLGFNQIRFLLAGYPRDFDRRTSQDVEHGVPDPWRAPNYGAKPGQVNPLPAWLGKLMATISPDSMWRTGSGWTARCDGYEKSVSWPRAL